MIKLMYSIFLGLIIVMFVGVGVSTFYSSPEAPEYEEDVTYVLDEETEEFTETDEAKQLRQENDAKWEVFRGEEEDYNRNVAIITMAFALLLLYVGLSKADEFAGISEGVLLGGVFTLFYSLIRGLMTEDDIVRFSVITVGLVVALWVGNKKFAAKVDKPKKA